MRPAAPRFACAPLGLALLLAAAPVLAQPRAGRGPFLSLAPTLTASRAAGSGGFAGAGAGLHAGWGLGRAAARIGATGGFGRNVRPLWQRLATDDARALGHAASRATVATFSYGIEVPLADPARRRTVPVVGVSVAHPVVATERREAGSRVSVSGTGVALTAALRRRVRRGLDLTVGAEAFAGTLRNAFQGAEAYGSDDRASGGPVGVAPTTVRGLHIGVGLTGWVFAMPRLAR